MREATVERVPLSTLASRMRIHPGSVYQRAIQLGIVVSRSGRLAYVDADDAAKLEAAEAELVRTSQGVRK